MGRTAGGVRAMKLGAGDTIVGADVVQERCKRSEILVVSRNGYWEYKTTAAAA
jgi:DNA gyrase/topoisomerase IV subunit A